jgi:hypothetical protein
MEKIFVRARPSKISVTETYYYKVSIGDNSSWEFKKAEGEIKLEFPYDGYYNGCFGKTAQEDLRKQDPNGQAKSASVGHLVIFMADKSTWKGALPITIDTENIQEKLEGSQKFSIQILYCPHKPETEPFLLGEVKLTDQEPLEGSPTAEYKPQYYPFLILLMTFRTPIREDLLDVGDLSQERLKELIKLVQGGQTQGVKPLASDCSAEQISEVLLDLARSNRGGTLLIGLTDGEVSGLSEDDEQTVPKRIAQAALMDDLPIPVLAPAVKTVDEDDDKKVAVVIVPPGLRGRHDGSKSAEKPLIFQDSQLLVRELLEEQYHNIIKYGKAISPDKPAEIAQLAKVFASLANNGGGYVLFGVQPADGEDYLITGLDYRNFLSCEQAVKQALVLVKPLHSITCRKNWGRLKQRDGNMATVLVIQISGDLSDVYSVENRCWQIENNRKPQVSALEPEEIFRLFAEKYELLLRRIVVKGEPPKITYGYVRWPYTIFDRSNFMDSTASNSAENCYDLPGTSRAQHQAKENAYLPSKYDPLRSAMEWHDVPLDDLGSAQFFETELRLPVQNPEELRDPPKNMPRDLEGHFEILLDPPMISGLEIIYFDALGEELEKEQRDKIVSQQTKMVLDVTLRTSDLFKKRDFIPYRRLEFEGVLPEPARYEDVKEALHDCGLRVVSFWRDKPIIQKGLSRSAIWKAESRSAAGEFTVWLRVTNYWYELQREISYGERTDKMPVPSGRMTIEIWGTVEGAENKELTALVNELQLHLKERFKYVKVG